MTRWISPGFASKNEGFLDSGRRFDYPKGGEALESLSTQTLSISGREAQATRLGLTA